MCKTLRPLLIVLICAAFLLQACLESNPQPSPYGDDTPNGGYDAKDPLGTDLASADTRPGEDYFQPADMDGHKDTLGGLDTLDDSGLPLDVKADLGDWDNVGDDWTEVDPQDVLDLQDALDGLDQIDTLEPPQPWRSELYPEDWTPEFSDAEGRFVPDFSYAGYRNSLTPPPVDAPADLFSVLDFGADPTGAADSTAAIQTALDAAEANLGGVVLFPAGLYRCDGLLTLSGSHVVLRGEGPQVSQVFFTRVENMAHASHLTVQGSVGKVLEWPLAVEGLSRSFEIYVDDATGLTAGDDVTLGWTITPEFIADHNMTGVWQAFNGTWQPFFRRQVVSVDTSVSPNRVVLDVPLRYPALLRDLPTLRKESGYLQEVGIEHLGIASAVTWEEAWSNERSNVVTLSGVKDAWVVDVASFPSPLAPLEGTGAGAHLQGGGIKVLASKRVTVAQCTLQKAQNRGDGGSGYLFEISMSSEVLTQDCVGLEGRHNFIQNWGFGTTGCVWQRCLSAGGLAVPSKDFPTIATIGYSEFHHSLATANLIEGCTFDDGWKAVNRQQWSTGAGLTSTQNVFWNNLGSGKIYSRQFAWGYVIGTQGALAVVTGLTGLGTDEAQGSAPEDWVEGLGAGAVLVPASLFQDQLERRLAP